MNDDQAIDRILHAVSATEPPPEMDRRILHALEAHTPAPRPSAWPRPSFASAASLFTAALIVATVLLPIIRTRHGVVHHPPIPSNSVLPHPHAAVDRSATPEPFVIPGVETQPASHPITPNSVAAGKLAPSAESFPAPPQPLTEQEKLLLRIVRRGDPAQLAMLDSSNRLEHEALDQADFEAFFQSPTPAPDESLPLLPTGDTK